MSKRMSVITDMTNDLGEPTTVSELEDEIKKMGIEGEVLPLPDESMELLKYIIENLRKLCSDKDQVIKTYQELLGEKGYFLNITLKNKIRQLEEEIEREKSSKTKRKNKKNE